MQNPADLFKDDDMATFLENLKKGIIVTRDREKPATEKEMVIIQPIIDQIKSGEIKSVLEAIEGFDNTLLNKKIQVQKAKYNSILRTAIESDALDIVLKLIAKNCNLAASDLQECAFRLWLDRTSQVPQSDISSTLLKIGKILLQASMKPVFNQDPKVLFCKIKDTYATRILPRNAFSILHDVLGKELFVACLFDFLERVSTTDLFEECLKTLVQNKIQLTPDQMFMTKLLMSQLKPQGTQLGTINEYLQNLMQMIPPEETKSLAEIDPSVFLKPQNYMENFPELEYWRLFVDGNKQTNPLEKGWSGYEKREKGCIQNMYDAFVKARENLETEKLSYEMTHTIHQVATRHLPDQGIRKSTTVNLIKALDALSYHGFLETTQLPYTEWYQLSPIPNSFITEYQAIFGMKYTSKEKIIEKVSEIIQDYHNNFDASGNDRTKQLQCIIKLVSDYARFHPYCDGNNRTAVCILNRELQKHGFPLSILNNPNELEGHSQDELFNKVYQGMQNFLKIKAGESYPGSKTTDTLIEENGTQPPIELKSTVRNRPKH